MIVPYSLPKLRLSLRRNDLRENSVRTVWLLVSMLVATLSGPLAKADILPSSESSSEALSETSISELDRIAYALPEFMPEGKVILVDHSVDPYGYEPYSNDPYYDNCYNEATQPVANSGWKQLFRPSHQLPAQIVPQGLIYRSYLASAKQSRMRGIWHGDFHEGKIWDITLGGQTGLYRRGSTGDRRPTGFQIDIEGSAQLRLDRNNDEDLDSTDYRFGIPFTWGNEVYQTKIAYYHISSHVADEFLVNNPGFTRLNFVRESIVWGHSYHLNPELRIYGEVGYAFIRDVAGPFEFQFGVDYSPAYCTGTRGAPFAAFNCHLREELEFGGNIVAQIGWAWRNSPASGLLRMGFEYYNGYDDQFSFYQNSQQKIGFGAWFDF